MVRNWTTLAILAAFVALPANFANAGWGSWGGSYGSAGGGSYGSWGGSWGYASGGSWGGSHGSHGSRGSHGGLFHRWRQAKHARHHARRAWRQSYYSSGGSWGGSYGSHGSWGSSGGYASTGYVTTSYGSTGGSRGGSSGGWITVEPSEGEWQTMPQEVEPAAPPAPAESGEAAQANPAARGVLMVDVPSDAKVVINGRQTRSQGPQRRYVSYGLKPGYAYDYEVEATVQRDGQTIRRVQTAQLRTGRVSRLAFEFNNPNPVQTQLTLHVPKDAEVRLSGSKTSSTGSTRTFSTTKIERDQKWADYTILVSVERDGQTLTKERTVTISGGDQLELSFDFDQPKLASAK